MEIQKIHSNDITIQSHPSKNQSKKFNVSGHAVNLDQNASQCNKLGMKILKNYQSETVG